MKEVDINEALRFRHPEIVVLVVTKSKEGAAQEGSARRGKVNIAPIGWAMLGSSNPKTWAVGIAKKHYTHKAILDSKEFTVCLPHEKQKDCGFRSQYRQLYRDSQKSRNIFCLT